MKKTFVMLVLGMLVAGSSMAQQAPQKERKHRAEQRDVKNHKGNRTLEERAARRTEKMSKELDLNKSQTRKLEALHLKQMQQREAMRAQYKNGDKRSRSQRQEMKVAREEWNAELKGILSKKQFTQYQAQREEMRAQHQERRTRQKNWEHRQQQRS